MLALVLSTVVSWVYVDSLNQTNTHEMFMTFDGHGLATAWDTNVTYNVLFNATATRQVSTHVALARHNGIYAVVTEANTTAVYEPTQARTIFTGVTLAALDQTAEHIALKLENGSIVVYRWNGESWSTVMHPVNTTDAVYMRLTYRWSFSLAYTDRVGQYTCVYNCTPTCVCIFNTTHTITAIDLAPGVIAIGTGQTTEGGVSLAGRVTVRGDITQTLYGSDLFQNFGSSVALNENGTGLAVGGKGVSVAVYKYHTNYTRVQSISHASDVSAVALNGDTTRLAVAYATNISIYDITTLAPTSAPTQAPTNAAASRVDGVTRAIAIILVIVAVSFVIVLCTYSHHEQSRQRQINDHPLIGPPRYDQTSM